MFVHDAGAVIEMFKNSFPYSLIYFIPLLVIIAPTNPVSAAQEFAVYRMQHFDLQNTVYGSRGALVNVEARSIDARMLTRRCVLAKLAEVTAEKIRDMLTQNAAGIMIILPAKLWEMGKEDQDHLLNLEKELMSEEISMPIYFTTTTEEIEKIYNDVKVAVNSDQSPSAAEAIIKSASANGYQIVINGANVRAMNDYQLTNIHAKLTGNGVEEQLPTIALVAHYDSTGIAPGLAKGADSNASGVIALLEIARLFSKLYSSSRTHAKLNIVFLLSSAGKFSYQGTKRWIEEQLESGENTLLQDVSVVLCIDSIGKGNAINMHVSKPPKEFSSAHAILNLLESVSAENGIQATMIHKKINLANEFLAWEHERFSIRRIPAVTLSAYETHKGSLRQSILDTRENVDVSVLSRNIRILAEVLGRYAYGLTPKNNTEIIRDSLKVDEELVSSWLSVLTNESRAAQILHHKHHLVHSLYYTLNKYLKDAKKTYIKADKRDPEFIFYDGHEYVVNIYSIKPAVFDLFLAVAIAGYLGALYLFLAVKFQHRIQDNAPYITKH
ncbi:DgyrCDS7151 [Dimorphilus gyrociliatus]|uniref:Nicalin n=1 Tax=Dimorphilus gyrociliatus TaxID=2664684 RepID=A0A7I8VQE5_9ANNE|nr:DgyrCDS7151 [Dimorphilus gyrociliatus]